MVEAQAESASEVMCPRCGEPFEARFYGPCPSCREQLAQTMSRQGEAEAGATEREGYERQAFEPAMNVVPNHVATRD